MLDLDLVSVENIVQISDVLIADYFNGRALPPEMTQ